MFLCTYASNLLAFLGHSNVDEATNSIEKTAIPLSLARGIISTLFLIPRLLGIFPFAIDELCLILIVGVIIEYHHVFHLVDDSGPLGVALSSSGGLRPSLHTFVHAGLGQGERYAGLILLRQCVVFAGGRWSTVGVAVIILHFEDRVDHVRTTMAAEGRAGLRPKVLNSSQRVTLGEQTCLGVGMDLTIEG